MSTMLRRGMTGAVVATAVASLFAIGPIMANEPAKDAKIHCSGVNACKGHGKCKSAKNACAGKNGCKGQGVEEMTEAECHAKGGHVEHAH